MTHPQSTPAKPPFVPVLPPEAILEKCFALSAFRAGQREVIDAVFTHERALAVFPTGGGKSLTYQLPALMLPGVTVVVSPLIALMKDQMTTCTPAASKRRV